MRPIQYTDEQIIEAGKQIESEGRRVTGFAIRKHLGGGKSSRLKTIWDTHEQSLRDVEAEPMHELPIEVQEVLDTLTAQFVDQFKELVTTLNNKAVSTAERRVSEVIKTAQSEQEKAEAELSDAELAVEELETKLTEETAKLTQSDKEFEQAQDLIDLLHKEIAELNKQVAVMTEKNESLTGKLAQEQEENTTREKEVQRLLEQIEDLKADKMKEAKNTDSWRARADDYEGKLNSALTEKIDINKKLATSSTEKRKLESDLKKSTSINDSREKLIAQSNTQISELEKNVSSLTTELEETRKTNSELKEQINTFQNELIKIASTKT